MSDHDHDEHPPTPLGDRLSELGEKLRLQPDEPPPAMPADVAAEFERIDAEVAERWRDELERQWRVRCPRRFVDATLDSIDSPVLLDELRTWLEGDPLPNLVLLGPVGTGKTHAAVAIMRELFVERHVADVRRWYVGTLIDRLDWRNPDHAETMARAKSCDVCVLDDLAADDLSSWAAARLTSLANERWEKRRTTIVTSNRELDDLLARLGERTYSRLVDEAAILQVGGPDRRLGR